MSDSKFPKMLDYEKLKQQFGQNQTEHLSYHKNGKENELHTEIVNENDALDFKNESKPKEYQRPLLTGSRLRSYAFAVLTRKEYSKADLIEKVALYAADRDEVIALVEELAQENYQSDQRVAEMTVRSQLRKGKGPNRIKLALKSKHLDKALVQDDMDEIDWYEQAYQLKVKKYGTDVSKDPKLKAKQIRFLQYRGFDMDSIMKAITRKEEE